MVLAQHSRLVLSKQYPMNQTYSIGRYCWVVIAWIVEGARTKVEFPQPIRNLKL